MEMIFLNKKELAKVYNIVSQGKISRKAALEEINIFTQTLQEALCKYNSVKFINRGTFEVIKRKPKVVSNPSTRELMKISLGKVVRFRASKNIIK
ncbi:DNA-binding protein HU [Fusobacterium varium ATCC 27725]|jgi:DNA-binding protein HU-beta|nr:DNA-binding protein HU [Fusobacterium varium ATCC 27725]VEH39031.1 HB [Fusobacterium varium]